jgi:hypothetical protein
MSKIHESLTVDRVLDAAQRQMFGTDNPGFCTACGNEQEGCEPDARNYTCEECGESKVFGAAELMQDMV